MAETRIQEMRATESARRGAKVLLLCAEGSTEEYIEPLYDPSYAVKHTVKDEDAFVKLSRQLLSATVGHYKKEEGRSSEISTFVEPIGVILRELFKNTHDWARTDINNVDITNSVRGIRFEVYQSPLAAFQDHVGRSPVLHEYVSTLRAEPRYLRVLEVSVFDSGPGLVERFLGRGIHEGFSLQEEYTTLLKCLELLWFANNPSAMVLTLLSVHKDVQAAELRDLDDHAMLHDSPLNRTLLFQREMRTRSVVIVEVRGQCPLQMTTVQDHEVIQALPSYRSDQALQVSILPRALRRREHLRNCEATPIGVGLHFHGRHPGPGSTRTLEWPRKLIHHCREFSFLPWRHDAVCRACPARCP